MSPLSGLLKCVTPLASQEVRMDRVVLKLCIQVTEWHQRGSSSWVTVQRLLSSPPKLEVAQKQVIWVLSRFNSFTPFTLPFMLKGHFGRVWSSAWVGVKKDCYKVHGHMQNLHSTLHLTLVRPAVRTARQLLVPYLPFLWSRTPRPQKASFEISERSEQPRCHTKTGQTHSLALGGLWGGAGEMQGGSRQIVAASSRRCFFSGIFSAVSVGFNRKKNTELEIHGTCRHGKTMGKVDSLLLF